jgi:hypothetical protein
MAEHERKGQKKQEKVEQKHRVRQQESEPVFDHFHAWEQGTLSIGETPFLPRMDEHAELLARAPSDNQRANIVLQLQQTYGNRYVQRLIESRVVQAKLKVSAPNDIYEQEADRVAKAVTRADKSQVQRQVEEEEEEEPLQTKLASEVQRQEEEAEEEEEEPLQTKLAPEVQRQEEEPEEEEEEPVQTKLVSEVQRQEEEPEEEEEEPVQTKAVGSQAATVSEDLEVRIKAERGGGHPLSDNTREPMEQSFGADFSGVRVHTDSEADALNKQLSAHAFTTGQDVFFRENEYSPGSDSGRELIAHELTHVVQQTGGQLQRIPTIQRDNGEGGKEKGGEITEFPIGETIPAKEPAKAPPPEAYDALVQQATYISASGGGLGGIFFLHSKEGARPEIVVKFEAGEAVRGKFAETLLTKAGLETTRSLAYPIKSRKGKKIKSKVEALVADDKCHTTDPDKLVRLNQVVTNTLNKGQVVMVTDCVEALGGSVAELLMKSQDMTPEQIEWRKRVGALDKLVETFNDVENAVDLGKMLVLDAFLGNQDRFDAANFANVMLAMRGGKWRFVLIDNEADVPTMMGEMQVRLRLASEGGVMPGKEGKIIQKKVTVKDWVDKLIEGGRALEKGETARINFLTDAQKAAKESVKKLQDEYFYDRREHLPFKEFEPILKAINWGQLQRGVLHGIHQGAHSLLNINLKEIKKLYEQEKKSLGKSEFLSLYGLELKWKYVEMIMGEKRMKHDAAMAVLVQMASKKMKDMTGSAFYIWPEEAKLPEQITKIKKK